MPRLAALIDYGPLLCHSACPARRLMRSDRYRPEAVIAMMQYDACPPVDH